VKKVSNTSKTVKKKATKPKVQKEAVGVKKTRQVTKSNPVDLNDISSLQQVLKQREDELAILNSVGEAMAKTLDVKTMAKIVGDKVQQIFAAEGVTIRLYDAATNLIQRAYDYDLGYQDLTETSFAFGKGLTSKIIETGTPLRFGTEQEQYAAGASTVPAQNVPKEQMQSYMGVPIITSNKVIGTVAVHSYKQNAYTESDVRLLQTLASNMGVAIQNARLFEAEQERVAELAVINSVQEGLASKLDIQGIYELVGDKLYEIFKPDILNIAIYHPETNHTSYPYAIGLGEKRKLPDSDLGGFTGQATDHCS
jgi:transcriptional regulator with GAF, ATPase, and Fis domain